MNQSVKDRLAIDSDQTKVATELKLHCPAALTTASVMTRELETKNKRCPIEPSKLQAETWGAFECVHS